MRQDACSGISGLRAARRQQQQPVFPSHSQPFSAIPASIPNPSHFTITFDTSPIVIKRIDENLRADPTVIRWMVMKKGSAMYVVHCAPLTSQQGS